MENEELQSSSVESEGLEYVPDPLPEEAYYDIVIYRSCHLPESYKAFVFKAWLKSLRFGNQILNQMPSAEYYKQYHLYIERLLAKPDSQLRFAELSDDRDVILGFSVRREDVLDYIYVKGDFRRKGIGTALMPKKITTFTHLTKTAITIWQEKYKDLKFNPFA